MRYWLKIAFFGTTPHLAAALGVTTSEFHSGKTKMMPPGDEKNLMASLAVSTQYNVTDIQTDGQTDTARQQRLRCS